jgi:16S rRNA (cytosine967-C5)-methyltransferase
VARFEATAGAQGPQWPYVRRRRLRELVFGVVRLRGRYQWMVESRARRSTNVDDTVRSVLYVALHELCEHDTAPFAVVDQAVRAAKRLGAARAAGFVNALLRGVLRDGVRAGFPDADLQPLEHAATWLSHPEWLVRRWALQLPVVEVLELCAANNRRPELVLRAPAGQRDHLLAALAEREWEARAHPLGPDAVEMVTRIPPALLLAQLPEPGVVQDAAAQLIAPLLTGSRPRRILDLCAAPGGKATHLASLLRGGTRIIAMDPSGGRLRRLGVTAQRLGLSNVTLLVGDGRRPPLVGGFDAVLVDAPCTGTGVLARRHDARWRRTPADVARLPQLQAELLRQAVGLARPGGTIVYATCSLEPEENDAVVDLVLKERSDLVELGVEGLVPAAAADGPRMRVWPHRHRADGAFAARLQRREGAAS